jgi:hypothetical protein
MADVYRDPLVALRDRVGGLELQVAQLQARLAPGAERFLPEELASTLVQAKTEVDRLATARDSQDDLQALATALEKHRETLEQIVGRAAEIEAQNRSLPPEAPTPAVRVVATSFQNWSEDLRDCRLRLERLLGSLDPSAWPALVNEPGVRGVRATFRVGQTPLALLYQGYPALFDAFQPTALIVATSVAPATPRLRLRPELTRHVLLKPLGLTRDVELGAEQFDGTLRWRYAPELFTIKAAARVLAALRAAPLQIKLLR